MPYIDIKTDHGAAFDGVTDDTAAWAAAIADWKATGREIVCPRGASRVTETILFDNVATAQFNQGPRIVSDAGPQASYILGSGLIGKPVLKIDGRNPNAASPTYFAYARVEAIGIRQENCIGADAFEYHAAWHSQYQDLHISGASGCGIFASNPQFGQGSAVGDNNASAHVAFDNVRITGCAGPAWSSAGSFGGITNHTFRHLYCLDNAHVGGAGQLDIDGALHISFSMCSVAATNNAAVPLVKTRDTHVIPDTVQFRGGEFGNASGTHFDIGAVMGLTVTDIRQVRRFGETAARYGFVFRTSTGLIRNIAVHSTLLAIDNTVEAPFTWMKRDPSVPLEASYLIYSPALNNAPGVSPYEGF